MYPDMVRSAIVIAATANCSAQNIAFDAVGRNAIISDLIGLVVIITNITLLRQKV